MVRIWTRGDRTPLFPMLRKRGISCDRIRECFARNSKLRPFVQSKGDLISHHPSVIILNQVIRLKATMSSYALAGQASCVERRCELFMALASCPPHAPELSLRSVCLLCGN